jgi:hypothetical protein
MPSIPTEALLDVNIVVAAIFADHLMHQAARLCVIGNLVIDWSLGFWH